MIIFLGSLLLVVGYSFVVIRELRQLQWEKGQIRGRDFYLIARNHRAVLLLALWIAVLGFFIGSVQYLDIRLADLSRLGGVFARVALLILLPVVWERHDRP